MTVKIAVMFHRFGPYHFARLEAASRRCEIIGVEMAAETKEYDWEKVDGPSTFKRVTLFPDGDSRSASKDEIRTTVNQCLSAQRPDVVAIPGWSEKGALAALQWCIRTQTPVVVMSESSEIDEPRMRWKEWTKRAIVGLCSAALVGGRSHADYLARLGMASERVFLGYDAVDNGYFGDRVEKLRKQKAESRNEFGLPENYFLASARFIEKKNLFRLLQAYASYRKLSSISSLPSTNFAPWDLVLLGDGPLRADLCRLIADLSLQCSVHLPGFKQYDELPVYYGLADAFVHASTTEQWGLVVNEAMASGLPVLVSNRCGCAPELVKEKVNGFTFDPFDVEEITGAMLKVSVLTSVERARMGSTSREIVADWGPERFAGGLVSAAEKAVEVGPRRPTVIERGLLQMLMRR